MRKLLLLFSILATTVFASDDFDKGYDIGFGQGWKHVRGPYTVAPVAPIAPIPKIGYDTFFDGYDVGFLEGVARAQRW